MAAASGPATLCLFAACASKLNGRQRHSPWALAGNKGRQGPHLLPRGLAVLAAQHKGGGGAVDAVGTRPPVAAAGGSNMSRQLYSSPQTSTGRRGPHRHNRSPWTHTTNPQQCTHARHTGAHNQLTSSNHTACPASNPREATHTKPPHINPPHPRRASANIMSFLSAMAAWCMAVPPTLQGSSKREICNKHYVKT